MKVVVIVKEDLDARMQSVLDELCETFHLIHTPEEAVTHIFMDLPDLILIDCAWIAAGSTSLIEDFRSNTVYGYLPIVMLLTPTELADISWPQTPVDDFILTTDPPELIRARLSFIQTRSHHELDTNPLTRLPGNETIMRQIQHLFDARQEIAIAWADIDNFKPFNDRYGFSRGDEVLLATSRIITNAVRELHQEPCFVGHIGGDDFVFICSIESVRALCEEIIERFDMVVRNFYNDDDLARGGIISQDRTGAERNFPVMSISLAVVMNQGGNYRHYGEASQEATEIKYHIKNLEGSNYMINRRNGRT